MLHDGRGANKPWLLENADPVTKITWHSWVEVEPGDGRATLDVRDGEIVRADLALRHGRGAGLRLSRHPRRRRRDSARLRAHRVRHVRPGPGRERARPARRAARRVRALPLDPGRRAEDRRLPEARQRRGRAPPARPRHRRGDAARGGASRGSPSQQAYAPRKGTRKHEVNTERELEAIHGWARGAAAGHRARRLRQRAPAVGHVDRPGQVHRLLRLRDRLLRGEQHSRRWASRRFCAAAR